MASSIWLSNVRKRCSNCLSVSQSYSEFTLIQDMLSLVFLALWFDSLCVRLAKKKSFYLHCDWTLYVSGLQKYIQFYLHCSFTVHVSDLQMSVCCSDNTVPAAAVQRNFIMATFDKPKECDICGKLLRWTCFTSWTTLARSVKFLCPYTGAEANWDSTGLPIIPC
jgi:hypothetical protein